MSDFLINDELENLDPQVFSLTEYESERQARRLIMIPSESTAPKAIRQALSSSFTNIYAEGYPRRETRKMSEDQILDYGKQLSTYRRYSDPRYYKGVEYVDMVEALAKRRCADLFAANGLIPDDLFVNVQPLSGAPANNAVYTAFLKLGDTILGMDLLHGGHLSHGSPVNRSGINYNAVHYTVDSETELIDYDQVAELAQIHKPRIIVAGYSSYPWIPDWCKFRQIADSVGAFLLADVSHIAGMIAAGVVPSPIGFAHVTTFTTHKTLCGPRGAVIITDEKVMSDKIDKAVFPGEQGGPHINTIAALALTFKIAQTEEFKALQNQIVKNAKVLSEVLAENGLRVPYKGTDSHIVLIDCKSIISKDGTCLSGDMGARILDLAGFVMNRNTIPGDRSAFSATGVRMGTTWLTQRGFVESDMRIIGKLIADVLHATIPYQMCARMGKKIRAKIDFKILEDIKLKVRDLAESKGSNDQIKEKHGYPHFFYIDDQTNQPEAAFELSGYKIRSFMAYTFSSDFEILDPGQSQATKMNTTQGSVEGVLTCIDPIHFLLTVPGEKAGLVGTWLRDLSTAFVYFCEDLCKRIPGPVVVNDSKAIKTTLTNSDPISISKPYYVGISHQPQAISLPEFNWIEKETKDSKLTCLNNIHLNLGAKMITFAGWELPVWYTSVLEEHNAVRTAAGLFDVTHMGVFQAEGPDASLFLDSVCSNDIHSLRIGDSCYTHFMDPHANVIDDLLVYRRSAGKFLVVVNAANEEKDWAWLNAVREGKVCVDIDRPWSVTFGRRVILRNLKDPKEGSDMRVDIALQGPNSRDILLELSNDRNLTSKIKNLNRTQLCECVLDGIDLVISRTGYTGEKMCFELFVHPDNAAILWMKLMEAGKPLGLLPCGLGARDSLRTEAGLPLYGHEMGGEFNLTISEAGFISFVKLNTPWFIGRSAFVEREKSRQGIVVRFRFEEKGVRMAHHGDPVLDQKGKMIGKVTSCAIDQEGFLTGQAFVENKYAAEGTGIYIFQSATDKTSKAPAELTNGDKVILPTQAKVIARFQK
ncbi:MAG: glycine cleavage system aminomethyltransferase GcvT [Anaerolineaceae bacterium]|nr:glycine cleavage system aminomethyltransferase GcvT [Anaerolineaceae bacterium]